MRPHRGPSQSALTEDPHMGLSQGTLRGDPHKASSQGTLIGCPHRGPSQSTLTGCPHMGLSQGTLREDPHRGPSQGALTGDSHRGPSERTLTGLEHPLPAPPPGLRSFRSLFTSHMRGKDFFLCVCSACLCGYACAQGDQKKTLVLELELQIAVNCLGVGAEPQTSAGANGSSKR